MSHQLLYILVIRSTCDHVRTIGMAKAVHMERDGIQILLNDLVAVLESLDRDHFAV